MFLHLHEVVDKEVLRMETRLMKEGRKQCFLLADNLLRLLTVRRKTNYIHLGVMRQIKQLHSRLS